MIEFLISTYLVIAALVVVIDCTTHNVSKSVMATFIFGLIWPWRVAVTIYNYLKSNPMPPTG